jgi:hypothetical protein
MEEVEGHVVPMVLSENDRYHRDIRAMLQL